MSPSPVRRVKVDPSTLRAMFNAGRYWERVQSGELVDVVETERHPSPPLAAEPFCTKSQIVHYYTPSAEKVAVVHQYLRPDGNLGLGGRPDPKKLHEAGVIYSL